MFCLSENTQVVTSDNSVIVYFSGIIMALSTALFGLYFKMILPNPNNSSDPDVWATLNSASPGTESSISWLAVVSLGCFVAGKWNRHLNSHYPKPKLSAECEFCSFLSHCWLMGMSCVFDRTFSGHNAKLGWAFRTMVVRARSLVKPVPRKRNLYLLVLTMSSDCSG